MKTNSNTTAKGLGVRHPKNHRVSISVDGDLWKEIEKQAKEKGLPVSCYVRMVLSEKYGEVE